MKRTDIGKIEYPAGLSLSDRRFVRSIITTLTKQFNNVDLIVVSCSAGIDSTVLTHALSQALRIRPNNSLGKPIKATAVYFNHQLRDEEEISREILHTAELAKKLTYAVPSITLKVGEGPGLQLRARTARYEALRGFVTREAATQASSFTLVLMAHQANDVAETKIYQFLRGKQINGIPAWRKLIPDSNVYLSRPLLHVSRQDIERYARCFDLKWCEDQSNKKSIYTRNFIRNELMPMLTKVNPGIVRMLGK